MMSRILMKYFVHIVREDTEKIFYDREIYPKQDTLKMVKTVGNLPQYKKGAKLIMSKKTAMKIFYVLWVSKDITKFASMLARPQRGLMDLIEKDLVHFGGCR